MSIIKKLGTTKAAAVTVAAAALLWAVLAVVVLALPISYAVIFLAFQLLAVVVPGLALSKLFNLKLSPLETLASAYGFGITALVAVYFMFAPFGVMDYIAYAVGVLSMLSILVLVLKRKQPLSLLRDNGELKIALIMCGFAALATFVLLSMSTLNPDVTGTRLYFHDTLNGVSLTTSASMGFPMQFLQMSGTDHWYHAFYFSYNAVFKLVGGLPSFEIVTKMSLITISPLVAAVAVALAKRMLKKNTLVWIASAVILAVPSTTYIHYLYQDTIGYPMGLAFALLAVLFFVKAQAAPCKIINRYNIVSAIFLVMCAGSKGPVAVTVLFAFGFSLLLTLIREKRWNVIPQGLLYALPFFAVYFLLYQSGVSDSMSWSFAYSAVRSSFSALLPHALPRWIFVTLCVLEYIIESDPIVFVSLITFIVYYVKRKDRSSCYVDFCFGGVLMAYFMINTFKQIGSSEIYFFTVLIPFVYIGALYCLKELIPVKNIKPARVTAAILLALLVPGLGLNIFYSARTYYGLPQNYDMGIKAAFTHSRFSPKITTEQQLAELDVGDSRRRAAITPQEYEAYLWLRDNTPTDSVIADGRYTRNNKYFYGTAFSERAFFLEGYGFVTMEDSNDNTDEKIRRDTFLRFFFEEEDEGYLPLMAREGCDYIMISQYINPGLKLSDKYCDFAFGNAHVAIYKLHAWGS